MYVDFNDQSVLHIASELTHVLSCSLFSFFTFSPFPSSQAVLVSLLFGLYIIKNKNKNNILLKNADLVLGYA